MDGIDICTKMWYWYQYRYWKSCNDMLPYFHTCNMCIKLIFVKIYYHYYCCCSSSYYYMSFWMRFKTMSKRSHGNLITPGIQVWYAWRLTWSYQESTSHGHRSALSSVPMLACPFEASYLWSRSSLRWLPGYSLLGGQQACLPWLLTSKLTLNLKK